MHWKSELRRSERLNMRSTAGEGVLDSVKRVPDASGHASNVQDIRVCVNVGFVVFPGSFSWDDKTV